MRILFLSLISATFLAACGGPTLPGGPPQMITPPEVATSGFLTAYTEAVFPMDVATLRAWNTDTPLIDYLPTTENLAPPAETQVIEGTWPNPGAARWLRLQDGHYVIERVTQNTPDFFQYQIFVFTNATGQGVEQIVGEQRFVPVEGGTKLEWTYNVLPKNWFTGLIVRRSMPEIEEYISKGLAAYAAAARQEVSGG